MVLFGLITFVLFSVDGLIRVAEYWSGVPNLRFYKELAVATWAALSLLAVICCKKEIALPRRFVLIVFMFIVTVAIGIVFSYKSYHQGNLLVPLWGLKTSFYYSALIPIVYFERNNIEKLLAWTIGILAVSSLFGVIFGLFQAAGGYELLEFLGFPLDSDLQYISGGGYHLRPMGFFRSAHEFGAFSLFVTCFLYPLQARSLIYRLLFLCSLLGVIISTSKSSISALPIMLLCFYLIKQKKYATIQKIKYLLPIASLAIIVGIVLLMSLLGFGEAELGSNQVVGSFVERLYMWQRIVSNWYEHIDLIALFFGRGYGYYGVGYQILFTTVDDADISGYSLADNAYLMVLGNTGIIGFALCLSLISCVFKEYERAIELYESPYLKSGIVFLLLMLYQALTANVIEAFPSQVFIYICLIMPFCYIYRTREDVAHQIPNEIRPLSA